KPRSAATPPPPAAKGIARRNWTAATGRADSSGRASGEAGFRAFPHTQSTDQGTGRALCRDESAPAGLADQGNRIADPQPERDERPADPTDRQHDPGLL